MATHLAAICYAKGRPFELQTRQTPKPGPNELLIAVKSVALNPIDFHMRDVGLFIATYPTVIGFDMSGIVLEVGDNVPTCATDNDQAVFFQPEVTRVAAYSSLFWNSGPDYGAFQERCLVPWQHVVRLPDDVSWSHAATLPVAVQVPMSAWDAMGIPQVKESSTNEAQPKNTREALLIWGASSSVGTMGVQTAKLLREDPKSNFAAVYATAGSENMSYVSSLGANRVFDYKDPRVVDAITLAAKTDGLVIRHCFLATGLLAPCQAVLKSFLDQSQEGEMAKIASAPVVPSDAEVMEGMETIFVMPSSVEEERLEQFQYWIGTRLRESLVNGTIRPSPEPTVVGKGLGAINTGLDRLRQGVSCTKLVVEVME